MGSHSMKIRIYLLLSELANLSLNMVKYMKFKVLNKRKYLKMFNNQGILCPNMKNGFNTLIKFLLL